MKLFYIALCVCLLSPPVWAGAGRSVNKNNAAARAKLKKSAPKPAATDESAEMTEIEETAAVDSIAQPPKEYRPRVNYHYRKTAVTKKRRM